MNNDFLGLSLNNSLSIISNKMDISKHRLKPIYYSITKYLKKNELFNSYWWNKNE